MNRLPELSARTRLTSAFTSWQRALDNYFDVDAFVIDLNALVSTLRTVTWLLQKQLRHVEGFDAWYASWQERLKSDPLMRWSVEARNHIEKQGDLEMRSTARLALVADWLGGQIWEHDVPPLSTPDEIVAVLARTAPARVKKDALLRVDRRWETASLPGHEILDACAHVYVVLNELLSEAEDRFRPGDDHAPTELPSVPREMVHGFDSRTAYLHLERGELLQHDYIRVERDDATVALAASRYGEPPAIPDGHSLEELARWHHEIGRGVLQADGHHITVALLFRGGRTAGVSVIAPRDQAEKYLLMESVARDVVTNGADQVLLTAEAWTASPLEPGSEAANLRAADRADRGEALVTHAAERGGRRLFLMSPFSRANGAIRLEPMRESDDSDDYVMAPILRAWAKSARTS